MWIKLKDTNYELIIKVNGNPCRTYNDEYDRIEINDLNDFKKLYIHRNLKVFKYKDILIYKDDFLVWILELGNLSFLSKTHWFSRRAKNYV